MRTEDLVFWLDVIVEADGEAGGVLCRRHGDSMVVPRGWTLDDRRDPDLHLFRPPARPPTAPAVRARRPPRRPTDAEQLELVERPAVATTHVAAADAAPRDAGTPDDAVSPGTVPPGTVPPGTVPPDVVSPQDVSPDAAPGAATLVNPRRPDAPPSQVDEVTEPADARTDQVAPWSPAFDADDDLDGLLAARGPLLSRAFRGTERPT